VRIDMLERLSDLIRARVAFRAAEGCVTPPTGATGDGGFRVVPELMSVVGCSGEEFASILKALGFRRERRSLAAAPAAELQTAGDLPAGEAPGEQGEVFDEIWRPAKRRDARHADKHAGRKPRHEARARGSKRERQKPPAHQARTERTRSVEHSPFAALEALRGRLAARQPEKS
jgi:ATP-dependent RNA helicase SUPV3L1/SUV3